MEKLDFTQVEIGHWSVKVDLDVAMAHFAFLTETLQWVQKHGQEMIARLANLSYEEWIALLEKAVYLWRDIPRSRSVSAFFVAVIERGITDLIPLAVSKNNEALATAWFHSIAYQLQPGARLGIGADTCGDDKSRELIERLARVAQILTAEHLLESLSSSRCPGDSSAQKLFVKHFTNW
ncbi:MAG: hypothetical protein V1902_03025 [Candidatus Falkowbacteria bacterium]